ncbi:Inositol-1-monophosphatase [Rhodobacteraceae bacterium THAF1]|uniref:3'(2'),5'-bisphosphate nucleotidase CysQ n=1 Tax=Palleronia sp. THAF1 TaxID=2587842 RepID=UPI000F3D38CC|nr:3'(2'),5'-bisphosphate nucleotidase CysQ [Palleronia sp. THAF1]QFU10028.1 Inositol-1-monophosphatase [Palleronia sp. THAF1]VDC17067.1 Inositol-1-monophosphatase [Rhodobacteraceae bacterium THAF1]
MPAHDLALLTDAAEMGGKIALQHWQRDPKVWTKDDDSPVSAADLAVDEAIRDALLAERSYAWMSEETPDDLSRLNAQHCFILDPIDGTRAFLKGEESWSVSLAVTTGPDVTAAVVHLPARGLTYTADTTGAWLNGDPITCADLAETRGARVLANKAVFDAKHWRTDPGFKRIFRPSIAYRMACVAHPKADAMLTFRNAWDWDIAAGTLIAQSAGARVTSRTGAALRFNSASRTNDGVIAANPTLHAAILGCVSS